MDFLKKPVRALLSVTFLAIAIVATLYISDREGDPESKSMSNSSNTPTKGDSILIVYLTRTGNTEAVARMIQDTVGGTLVSLELEQPYPEDYQALVAQVVRENESGYLPPLKTSIENIESYDTVLEGFSVEGGRERDGILFVMEADREVKVREQVYNWLKRIRIPSQ
jgi:hypothetical protein